MVVECEGWGYYAKQLQLLCLWWAYHVHEEVQEKQTMWKKMHWWYQLSEEAHLV